MGTPESRLAGLAEKQHGVVAREQLRALGLGEHAIVRRVKQGRLQRLHRGVYAVGHRALRPEGRMLAAVLACGPGAVLSHRSAAALWGLRYNDRARVDVTTTEKRGVGDPAIDLHRARTLDPTDITEHRGIPITTVARTFVDLAGVVDKPALDRALNQAEILGLYDHAALTEILDRSNGRRGAQALRTALAQPPALTRSELEAQFLTLCADRGLPQPSLNAAVCGYEVDFLWRQANLIVETDGYAYHRTRQAFERDRRRDGELKRAGYEVLRVTYWQVKREPEWVASTIQALLKRRCADLYPHTGHR
jgi:very-short-patch-repair endonuclease